MIRRTIWRKVFGFPLLPPLPQLRQQLRELQQTGARLWDQQLRPLLEPDFPRLFVEQPTAEQRILALELRRVGAVWYTIARELTLAHTPDEDAADEAGVVAMWFGLAAAVLDHLLDTRAVTHVQLEPYVSPGVLRAALPLHPPPEEALDHLDRPGPRPPELLFFLRALEAALAGIRRRLRAAASQPLTERLHHELTSCLEHMAAAELRSTSFRLGEPTDLDRTAAELRVINTLGVWLAAYVGLIGSGELPAERKEALLRVTTHLGEVGWILDALSDVAEDWDAGVWSLAWIEYARTPAGAWLRDPRSAGPDPDPLAALLQGPTCNHLLSRVETALAELERQTELLADAPARLGLLARALVWIFLVPPPADDEGGP